MARILFTWELGANFGHLARLVRIAEAQRELGNEILFVVVIEEVARQILTPRSFSYIQAPIVARSGVNKCSASYADLLIGLGFDNPTALLARVDQWLSIYGGFKADVIVADHSPTAILAARIANLPTLQVGSTFEIPPPLAWPSFDERDKSDPGRLQAIHQVLLASINQVLRARWSSSLRCVTEVFNHTEKSLLTFAELDHYGVREAVHYVGPIYTTDDGTQIHWRSTDLKKIFVYAWPGLPGLHALLHALKKIDAEVICMIPTLEPSAAQRFENNLIRIFCESVQLENIMEGTDLLITHSGFGTVSAFLKAGVPILIVPSTVEQLLVGKRIEENELGMCMGSRRGEEFFSVAVNQALQNQLIKQKAVLFRQRYSSFSPADAISRVNAQLNLLTINDAI